MCNAFEYSTVLFCHQFQNSSLLIPLAVADCDERLHNNNLCYHSYFLLYRNMMKLTIIFFPSIVHIISTIDMMLPFSKWYQTMHCSKSALFGKWMIYADMKCFDEHFFFFICPTPHALFTEMLSIGNNRAKMRSIFIAWITFEIGNFPFQNPSNTVHDYRSLKVKLDKTLSPEIWSCIEHRTWNESKCGRE